MKYAFAAAAAMALSGCGNAASDPDSWSCEALIAPIIEMSEERSVKILEITDVQELGRLYGPRPEINCRGSAEWSEGYGVVDYGAYVSSGNNIMLRYEQK